MNGRTLGTKPSSAAICQSREHDFEEGGAARATHGRAHDVHRDRRLRQFVGGESIRVAGVQRPNSSRAG